jgi:hypothetical protein
VFNACQQIFDWNVQVTAEAGQMALEICAAETTVEMLTKVRKSVALQFASPRFILGRL